MSSGVMLVDQEFSHRSEVKALCSGDGFLG